jgi:hypothetical protein
MLSLCRTQPGPGGLFGQGPFACGALRCRRGPRRHGGTSKQGISLEVFFCTYHFSAFGTTGPLQAGENKKYNGNIVIIDIITIIICMLSLLLSLL